MRSLQLDSSQENVPPNQNFFPYAFTRRESESVFWNIFVSRACSRLKALIQLSDQWSPLGSVQLLVQGCQTHLVVGATFSYLDFVRARLCWKKFKQARPYISVPQTFFVCRHRKPVDQILRYASHGIFRDHHFSGQRFPEILWCSPKRCSSPKKENRRSLSLSP